MNHQHEQQSQHGHHTSHSLKRPVNHDDPTEHEGHSSHDDHANHNVNDMLRRFIVSAILTLPLLLFSHIGALLGLHLMPPFGLSMGLFGFILATPVVWWGG